MSKRKSNLISFDAKKILKSLSKEKLLEVMEMMLRIRNFELRAESAYQHGKIGGFFHSYIGQEAIAIAAVSVLGKDNWWTTTYRCHGLALCLGESPNSIMAELYGKETGNALGRGGSMHLYSERLLGGFGIVGGQLPIATGAAFSLKHLKQKGVSVCFLGDGAVAQGAFHEALNLAVLWELPCLFVIENNQWGMGTYVSRSISVDEIAEKKAPSYGMKGITFDGMDYFSCHEAFSLALEEVEKTGKPVLMEAMTERFKGHSISDPALYRSKDELKKAMQRDPLHIYSQYLFENKVLDEAQYKKRDQAQREEMIAAMEFAEQSPWPDPATLEDGVFAKETKL